MKAPIIVLVCGLASVSLLAQDKPILLMLASTSSTPPAYLLKNLPEVGCPNVSIVLDASKADYILDAKGGDFEGAQGSEGPHGPRPPRPKAQYSLTKNGVIVFGTTPIKEKNAVKDLCKFLLKAPAKDSH